MTPAEKRALDALIAERKADAVYARLYERGPIEKDADGIVNGPADLLASMHAHWPTQTELRHAGDALIAEREPAPTAQPAALEHCGHAGHGHLLAGECLGEAP